MAGSVRGQGKAVQGGGRGRQCKGWAGAGSARGEGRQCKGRGRAV